MGFFYRSAVAIQTHSGCDVFREETQFAVRKLCERKGVGDPDKQRT